MTGGCSVLVEASFLRLALVVKAALLLVPSCSCPVKVNVLGKKESIHHPAPVQNFSLPKKRGHRGKISVVDMVFLVFIGFLCPPPAWKVFFEARKVPQKIFVFFFGGGSVCFFSSLTLQKLTRLVQTDFRHLEGRKRRG